MIEESAVVVGGVFVSHGAGPMKVTHKRNHLEIHPIRSYGVVFIICN